MSEQYRVNDRGGAPVVMSYSPPSKDKHYNTKP